MLAQADKRLVLLSAPAGYGKTTLLLDFADAVTAPVAWFNADEDDRDLRSFGEYMLASLRQAFPAAGRATHALLQSTRGSPDPVILAERFTADLSALPDALNLVVDDYHLVDESLEVGRFLAALLTRLPSGVRLILVGRTIPSLTPETLSLLAAQGEIAGLGMNELRFTTDEVRELFEQCFNLHLPEAEVTRLAAETEGWIAGIRLTTHTLWQGLLRDLVANRGKENLYAYLANQVLEQQTPVDPGVPAGHLHPAGDAGRPLRPSAEPHRFRRDPAAAGEPRPLRGAPGGGREPALPLPPALRLLPAGPVGAGTGAPGRPQPRAGAIQEERRPPGPGRSPLLRRPRPRRRGRVIEDHAREVYEAGRLITLTGWLDALPPELLDRRPQLLRLKGKALLDLGKPREALHWLKQVAGSFR